MLIPQLFRSVIDQDSAPVVICDLDHTIVYMNPSAVDRYARRGGAALVGSNLLDCHNARSCALINDVVAWFKKDVNNNIVHTFYNPKENKDVYMVALRDDSGSLIGYYEKHEYRTRDDSPMYSLS